ncbi:hypothetical protein BD413DRAFT_612660 [Trametes elegans]|nr:hypothetical protein BD413DRAFT_612660 [Trametes elegans]
MSLVHGLPDKKIKRYTGISIRALKRLLSSCATSRMNSVGMSLLGMLLSQSYVGWVTQLIVDIKQRRRFIATSMLQQLRHQTWFNDVTAMGMVSSHPAACNALCKLLNGDTRDVDLAYIREHASAVLQCSTVQYLKGAQLRGAFLGEEGGSFSAFTGFFVDHHEPLQVLQTYMSRDRWSFGDLLNGHEFLILVPVPVPSSSDIDF